MNEKYLDYFKNKNILITGHTGFKGSWLAVMLYYLDAKIYGISREKRNGIYNIANISELFEDEYFFDIGGDSSDELDRVLNEIKPEFIFHFAAQSLVIKSYSDPKDTIYSNIIGTYNILESSNKVSNVKSLIIATTDKVYKNPNQDNHENSELGGDDFYSASKVSAELITKSFIKVSKNKNLNISVVRSGNVIGGGDRSENRLITDLVDKLSNNENVAIRMPNSTRPWQYILDSLNGYLKIAYENNLKNVSEVYNLNSLKNNNFNVQHIAKLMIKSWGSDSKLIVKPEEEFKEVLNLKINSEKANKNLHWEAKLDIQEIVNKVIKWEKHYIINNSFEYCLKEVEEYLRS